jgi:protein TonB
MKPNYALIFLLIMLSLPVLSQNKKKAPHKTAPNKSAVKTDSTDGTKQFTEVDEMPTPVKTAKAEYPEDARKAGVEGTVWVNILVGTDGTVKDVTALKMNDGSPEIKQSALDAAKQYTFKPAMKNNKPVQVWVTMPFRFKLK